MAIWGGETLAYGKQPDKLSDYLRIFFLRPGSKNHLEQERINTLGNHLGIWDFLYEKEKTSIIFPLTANSPGSTTKSTL